MMWPQAQLLRRTAHTQVRNSTTGMAVDACSAGAAAMVSERSDAWSAGASMHAQHVHVQSFKRRSVRMLSGCGRRMLCGRGARWSSAAVLLQQAQRIWSANAVVRFQQTQRACARAAGYGQQMHWCMVSRYFFSRFSHACSTSGAAGAARACSVGAASASAVVYFPQAQRAHPAAYGQLAQRCMLRKCSKRLVHDRGSHPGRWAQHLSVRRWRKTVHSHLMLVIRALCMSCMTKTMSLWGALMAGSSIELLPVECRTFAQLQNPLQVVHVRGCCARLSLVCAGRVKKLVTEPYNPHMIISCSEDGSGAACTHHSTRLCRTPQRRTEH